MTGTAIDAVDLTKRFGTRIAVRGLTFSARQGEVVGLLGPNGAGKTTTIRLLTTILKPTSGHFSVAGIPGSEPALIRRRVGVMPESAGYPGEQTGHSYLRYHARLFGRSRADATRVAERLLDEVGLSGRAGSRIATYSRGMRQRLGIARALVNDPVVVILDEPTLGLDPAGQRQVLALIRDVAERRGATVVLSTHTLPDVEEVCTAVLILADGKLIDSGTVSAVTAVAAAPRAASLRVPADRVARARQVVAAVAGLRLDDQNGGTNLLRVSLADGNRGDAGLNAALAALLAADVPVLEYGVEGARLSDAFLAMTTDGKP
ncbi:MAG TPA: ABC transporter ATP-binding protein [Actinoplanes sp.]|jgi:ABC-2 type transport system ATP-binding protein|nr:ABC transporter ATP-binding protein [Actinoplanes sp.]